MEIKWKKFIGQERIKEILSNAVIKNKLGHAYLFSGDIGRGTFAAAVELAMIIHCKNQQYRPCYECDSCKTILSYSNPDFHIVMPIALKQEYKRDNKITEEGWHEINLYIKKRLNDPYILSEFSSTPNIPVDWIREIIEVIFRGSVGKNRNNIVIIDGIETMNKESANAMLKTLEEPPERTLFILLTEKVHSVLPTIVSRCQLIRFPPLHPDTIKSFLLSSFSISGDDPRLESIIHTGSLSLSRFLYENIDSKVLQDAIEYWKLIEEGDWLKIFKKIDEFSKTSDITTHENLFIFLLHSLRNGLLESIEGGKNYIIGETSIKGEWKEKKVEYIEKIIHLCEKAISQLRSRVNISLIFFNFANSIMELNNGQ